jgi:alpha-1,2-mannosyltransferase
VVLRWAPLAFGLGTVVFLSAVWIAQSWGPGDAVVYLAAGERLNAGHELYALGPGDRPVELRPPYWTVPLLSPPLIAVVWRPLAAVPELIGLWVWTWSCTVAAFGTLGFLIRREPVRTGLILALVGVPFSVLAWSGNVDALRLPATIVAFWLATRGRPLAAGVVVGLLTAVKLTPAVLVLWLLVTGRWRAVVAAAATVAVATLISVLGAGWDAHLDYLSVARSSIEVGAEISLAGLARTVGAPAEVAALLPPLAAVVLSLGVIAVRHDPPTSYRFAILAQVLGAPAAGMHTFGLLLALVAPEVLRGGGPPHRQVERNSAQPLRREA